MAPFAPHRLRFIALLFGEHDALFDPQHLKSGAKEEAFPQLLDLV
jgi:hypothetical protein